MTDLDAVLRKRYLARDVPIDVYLCANKQELKSLRDDKPAFRTELWTVKELGVSRAVLLADFQKKQSDLPPVLARSPELSFLQVPRVLADRLRDSHLANLHGELRLLGQGTADISAVEHAPHVTHLGGYTIDLRFRAAAFPSLKGLVTWEKNRRRLLVSFEGLPKLRGLMAPAHEDILSAVPTRLGFLHLMWGSLEDLADVARLPRLEWLVLERVTKLTSLAGLMGHANLESVTLTRCAGLKDVSALAECPKLRRVRIDDCKLLSEREIAPLRRALERRGGALEVEPS